MLSRFAVESLESRLLYAMTPADPRPNTLGKSFDITERQDLLARLSNLPSSTYTTLNNALKASNIATFDNSLLGYMRSRSSAKYFFQPGSADSIADYVNNNLSSTSQIQRADRVTDQRLFPAQSSVEDYTVQLPANINWADASPSSNPEFINALNRQEWWVDLAQGYQYSGNNKYVNELKYELADWAYENPTFTMPSVAKKRQSYGFDMSIRMDNQLMAYFSILGSGAWDGASNSLMLYKLIQQGDVVGVIGNGLKDNSSNRSIAIGRSTMYMGVVLPEVDSAAAWEADGRAVLYRSIDGQFYSDGTHREQSPGYAVLTIDDLLDARRLDVLNNNPWDAGKLATLENAVDALWQQLSPNGDRPAIGDTYRISASTSFLKAAIVLDETRWPEAKPRARDAWVLGTAAVNPYLGNPLNPALGTRGTKASLAAGGNYILRSGNDAAARQISFDAGPKGGGHGHFDLLNFELFGYGRPLISDPGAYYYNDADPKRAWAVSTKAHNTVGVADLNHGALENTNAIKVSGFSTVAGGTMISAGHQGYHFTAGAPTVSRSMWYDGNNTMVIVDFVESTTARNWEQSFMLQNQNTSRDLANGLIYTKNASGGNVRIQSLLRPGQAALAQMTNIFTTSETPPYHVDPATRYYVQHLGTTYAVFATLITAHDGNTASSADATASWVTAPTKPGQSAVLSVNGTNITFSPPAFQRLDATATSRGTYNDIAYDAAGRLHQVFYDRDERNLKYAVRDTNGVWSSVQIIDDSDYAGYDASIAIDQAGRPGVAYQDAINGDLKYAYLSPISNTWDVQTVDVPGSTGAYPNLIFSRGNGPMIAYYNKSKGDLRVATSDSSGGWTIQTVDSGGDVGRFPSIQLDPNRPTTSKFAIAYEDTTHGTFKYAIQYKTGFRYETIDASTTIAGGYISMKFYDTGKDGDARYLPAATYYDAGRGRLKYAVDTGGIERNIWSATVIAGKKRQGLYSKLSIEGNKPRVFFFDGTNNRALFLSGTRISGGTWSLSDLGAGGREIHYAYRNGKYVFTTLDEASGYLNVKPL